jgi:hypothetical protein
LALATASNGMNADARHTALGRGDVQHPIHDREAGLSRASRYKT